MSGSALPYKRSSPSWLKITSAEIGDIIAKLAKKGMTPSQIGVLLRDNHGVAQVSSVTNSKILRILKGQGLAPTLPEDLYCLIKKAVSVRKHMERNRKDMDSKFRLILIESRIHPPGPLLQARQEARAQLEVRLRHRVDPRCLSDDGFIRFRVRRVLEPRGGVGLYWVWSRAERGDRGD